MRGATGECTRCDLTGLRRHTARVSGTAEERPRERKGRRRKGTRTVAAERLLNCHRLEKIMNARTHLQRGLTPLPRLESVPKLRVPISSSSFIYNDAFCSLSPPTVIINPPNVCAAGFYAPVSGLKDDRSYRNARGNFIRCVASKLRV